MRTSDATQQTNGIGHRIHRDHRTEDIASAPPMAPMRPMPDAGEGADICEGDL